MQVSVITCFYNTAPYLQEAIDSVLRQTYTNWQLLLIDDGSTDGSTEIAQANAKSHPEKILYLAHPGRVNRGLSASRNLGISKAAGLYITFLDADDVWLPGYLEYQVNLIQKHQVAMVCEATDYWYDWHNPKLNNTIIPVGAPQDQTYLPPQLALQLYPLGKGAAPCVCGIIAEKSALQKLGGFDEAFTGMYEDQVFLSKFYLNEPVYISAACNNRYRQRPDSLMGNSLRDRKAYFEVRGRFLEWLEAYMKQTGQTNKSVAGALKKALVPYRYPAYHFLTSHLPGKIWHRMKRVVPGPLKALLRKTAKPV